MNKLTHPNLSAQASTPEALQAPKEQRTMAEFLKEKDPYRRFLVTGLRRERGNGGQEMQGQQKGRSVRGREVEVYANDGWMISRTEQDLGPSQIRGGGKRVGFVGHMM